MDTSPRVGGASTLAPARPSRRPRLVDEPLKVVGRRDPLIVAPGTPLSVCLDLIRTSGMGDSVLVTDADGRLVGVLAERDVFARLVAGREQSAIDLAAPVETLMNTTPHSLQLDQPVRAALELMETGTYRNIPLVDSDGLVEGIVRPLDVIRYLAESFPEKLLNLPPLPQQQMDAAEGA